MKCLRSLAGAGVLLACVVSPALAQNPWRNAGGPSCAEPPRVLPPGCAAPAPGMPGTPGTPGTPGALPGAEAGQQQGAQPPTTDAFAQAPEAGGQVAASSNPGMFGDLLGFSGHRLIFIPQSITNSSQQSSVRGNLASVIAPVPSRTAFKIMENESPRPTDRVFLDYSYYNNVDKTVTGIGVPSADLHREVIGFERTFADGNGSFGMRLPFTQLTGGQGLSDYQVSDLSMIFKYALVNDRDTGNVVSTGMVLTLPTGQELKIAGQSSLNDVVFQPYLGLAYNMDNAFVEAFSSLAVPTDIRDVTLLFNSISVGYWAMRRNGCDSLLTGIIPVAEVHVNTPLNHRGTDHFPLGFPDTVDVVTGVHWLLQRAELGTAIGFPLTGPKPDDFEVRVTLNYRF